MDSLNKSFPLVALNRPFALYEILRGKKTRKKYVGTFHHLYANQL